MSLTRCIHGTPMEVVRDGELVEVVCLECERMFQTVELASRILPRR